MARQEGDGQPVAEEELPVEPLIIADDELQKANAYVVSFEDGFRALAVLDMSFSEETPGTSWHGRSKPLDVS